MRDYERRPIWTVEQRQAHQRISDALNTLRVCGYVSVSMWIMALEMHTDDVVLGVCTYDGSYYDKAACALNSVRDKGILETDEIILLDEFVQVCQIRGEGEHV